MAIRIPSPAFRAFHFLPNDYRLSRFMLATPEDILSDLSRDLDALAREHRVLDDMEDELGVMFVDRAVEKVRRQMERARKGA